MHCASPIDYVPAIVGLDRKSNYVLVDFIIYHYH